MFSSKFTVLCNACKKVIKEVNGLHDHSKCIIPFKKKYFKHDVVSDSDSSSDSEIEEVNRKDVDKCVELVKKCESRMDFISSAYKLQIMRKNLFYINHDLNDYIEMIQTHHKLMMTNKNYSKNTLPHILNSMEQRMHLLNFHNNIDINDLTEFRKSILLNISTMGNVTEKLNTIINTPILMYMDVEKCLKLYFEKQNICYIPHNQDDKYACYIFNDETLFWEMDNRLFKLAILFHDNLWAHSLTLFNDIYKRVFKTNDVIDDKGELYFENDDYPGVSECRRLFINLMKCSSVYNVHKVFMKYVKHKGDYKNIDRISDTAEDIAFKQELMRSYEDEHDDKLKAMFQFHELNKVEINLLNKYYRNY
jgi:hypothetical protein